MFALIATTLLLSVDQNPPTSRPPALGYTEALRCSGLAQAASELEGGESGEGRALYDAALYWSLTTIQAGQAAGRATAAVEADMTRARIQAVRQLTARDEAARTALQTCRARTPNLG